MKKIVLIEAKSSHLHLYSNINIPREGSVLLGTILRNLGYDVSVYVEDFSPIDINDFLSADLIGFSTLTSTAPRSFELAKIARRAEIPVVFGGTHVSFLPDEALRHGDYVLRGEAEKSFPELLRRLELGEDLHGLEGLSFRENGSTIHNPDAPFLADLDSLPIPDYSLIRNGYPGEVITIGTARGCPFDCSFCSVTTFNGKTFRYKSVERVLDELEYQLSRHKVRYLFWADDIFNYDKKRAKDIISGMIERKLTPRWGVQMRHEASRDEELLNLMKEANCERVMVGFESINQRTLDLYGKREKVEHVRSALDAFHRHKLKVHGMFVVGSDEDDVNTIRSTRKFVQKNRLDTLQLLMLIPLPGARDFEPYRTGEKRYVTRNWELYDGHHAVIKPAKMSTYDLQVETMRAMRKFYSFPRALKRLVKGDVYEFFMRIHARGLVKAWFRNPENLAYMQRLKSIELPRLSPVEAAKKFSKKPAIILSDLMSGSSFSESLHSFFKELDVKVVTVKRNLGNELSEKGALMTRRKKEIASSLYSYLEDLRGKADFVLVPRFDDIEKYQEKFWQEVESLSRAIKRGVNQLPEVVTYTFEDTTQGIEEMLMKLGHLFTDDEQKIKLAFARSFKSPI